MKKLNRVTMIYAHPTVNRFLNIFDIIIEPTLAQDNIIALGAFNSSQVFPDRRHDSVENTITTEEGVGTFVN
jgi:hypothetical protein